MTDVALAPGEDLTLHIPVVDEAGAPVDVTGATGEFPVYDAPLSHTVLFTGAMTITDAAGGLLTFTLPGAATAAYANEYHVLYYETWLVNTAGARTRLDTGKLVLA